MMQQVICGDCLDWAKTYDGPKFHALLCDPPYHLYSRRTSGEKDQSGFPGGRANPTRGGFMGKKWDGGDIAYRPETWAALAEHLLPGAFGMAFASSRGWHRLACAIEDAGLIIHPSIFGWCYGSGFPKATRVKDAPAFEGHRYGLQAMKPALEPIILFQKPYIGKPVECIAETGAGALNIDEARIPGPAWKWGTQTDIRGGGYGSKRPSDGDVLARNIESNPQGRWPANFFVDEETAPRLGKQSGRSKSGAMKHEVPGYAGEGGFIRGRSGPSNQREDSGTAARFFLNVDWQLEQADPVFYCAKSSRRERDRGLEGTFTPAGCYGEFAARVENGVVTNPRTNSPRRNPHPCCKPLKLTQWLATLLLPPKEYTPRRILVPFAGSGSEMIGAALAGWEEIVGIEMEAEYIEIAKARLGYWMKKIAATPERLI